MENYQTSNILFLEFSHSEVSQLYLPINAIFPMSVAVYLQTPDKRLLKYNISLTSSVEYRCLRILRLLTLETRFLGADLIEVFEILRGFEDLHSERFFQVIGDGAIGGAQFQTVQEEVIIVWT